MVRTWADGMGGPYCDGECPRHTHSHVHASADYGRPMPPQNVTIPGPFVVIVLGLIIVGMIVGAVVR